MCVNRPQLGLCLAWECVCPALVNDPIAGARQPAPCGISLGEVLQEGVCGELFWMGLGFPPLLPSVSQGDWLCSGLWLI